MTVRLAVFDCDGTLADGQAAITGAMERAFADCALACPPRHEVLRIVGLSLPNAVRRLVPDESEETHGRIVAAYKDAFFQSRVAGTLHEPLFDGVGDLIDALDAQGWTLGVATGKSDRGLAGLLAVHGLSGRFATLQTADRHPSKPHPAMLEAAMAETGAAPETTVMIGDTTYDIAMARAAGVRALGVAWGYHAPHELIAAGAAAVARSPGEIKELIDG
ncbi:HAD-IA family hydrolase [Tsuneonella sp. HG222]